jgi:tRNA pseudouridine38-40 synthase
MSQRYFVELSYDGTPFHGWQIQQNAKSIQQTLNEALSTVIRHQIYVIGCGRTDTGVHAKKFIAHFDCPIVLDQVLDIMFKVNCVLPKEIALHQLQQSKPEFHARFDATSRAYEYFISKVKNPFTVMRAYEYRETLDIDLMNKACEALFEYKDFTSFAKLHGDTETNLCDIHRAEWSTSGNMIIFHVVANRFLRNMVRAMVGTLIEVGRKKITVDEFRSIIESKDRSKAGYSVPAHGLYLVDISYPPETGIA